MPVKPHRSGAATHWVGALLAIFASGLVSPAALALDLSFQSPISGDSVAVSVTLSDVEGGGAVDVSIAIPAGQGDLLGLFGNVSDEGLIPQFAIEDATGLVTQWQFQANKVWKVGAGNTMTPVKGWDWGVRVGQAGSAGGAVEAASFRLSAPGLDVSQLVSAANQGWLLGVRVQSTTGAQGSAKVGLSADAPIVFITAPEAGALLSSTPADVSGTVSGASAAVDVNGVSASVGSGNFQASVPLTEGANTLTATASNALGSSSDLIDVTLDSTPPLVAITAPADGTITAENEILVTGTVTDASEITSVTVAGQPASLAGNAFSATIALAPLENTIVVVAVDAAGNEGQASVTVTYGELPTIAIDEPADGALLGVAIATVSGSATGIPAPTITVNGVAATLSGSSYSAQIPLSEGANAITANATNVIGQADATRNVTVDTIAPVVSISSPTAGSVINAASVEVTGTATDASVISSVTVNGIAATLTGGSFSATVPLVDGPNTLTAIATDAAGNGGNASIGIERLVDTDEDGVEDSADQCPATPSGESVDANGCSATQLDGDNDGVSDAADQCSDTPAGESVDANGCSATQLDGDNDGVSDAADQCSNTSFEELVNANGCSATQLDDDSDGVSDAGDQCPGSPAGESVDVNGCALSQLDSDSDGVSDAVDQCVNTPVGETVFANGCAPDLDGDGTPDSVDPDRDGDGVVNESDAFPDDPTRSVLPFVEITSPLALTTLGSSPVEVTGVVDSTTASLTINGVPVTALAGGFSALVALEEGHNTIVARIVDADGIVSTDSVSVSLDTTPPYITVESHFDGQVVYASPIIVTGLINDIVRGTIEQSQAVVTVAGENAEIVNRSYSAAGIVLTPGLNTIEVVASDQVGNTANHSLNIDFEPPAGKHLELVGGQDQSDVIGEILADPLVIRVVDDSENPVVGQPVVFRVTQGAGVVGSASGGLTRAVVENTDSAGVAQTLFRLGRRSGTANHKVRARVVGYDDEIVFVASAEARLGDKVSVISGNNQRGGVHQPLPGPFVVAVTDDASNLVSGARVEFSVSGGSGNFEGGSDTITVITDSDGRASAQFTLGGLVGLDEQRVTATLLDKAPSVAAQDVYAGFSATGFEPGDPGDTTISGVVLDNQRKPVPGVTIRIEGTTREAIADAEGVFSITEAPVGPVHLIADGSTAAVEGEFPSLSYNLVAVSGVDNPLSAPIYMVRLNLDNAVYAGLEDVEVTLDDVPGFKLEVPAGSVTFPDGSNEGYISVTAVNASAVPMAPPNGMQPQFIVTIQPTGTMFDPPAPLTLPNVDGYAPGEQVEMFSYDHDLEEFVTIGLGTVSEDGSVLASNLGIGVIKAGWHCGTKTADGGCSEGCPVCADCRKSDCMCIALEDGKSDERLKDCQKCESGKTVKDKEWCCQNVGIEPGSGIVGKALCCNGEPTDCVYPDEFKEESGNSLFVKKMFEECVQKHEDDHKQDLLCEPGVCFAIGDEIPRDPDWTSKDSECRAYKIDYDCMGDHMDTYGRCRDPSSHPDRESQCSCMQYLHGQRAASRAQADARFAGESTKCTNDPEDPWDSRGFDMSQCADIDEDGDGVFNEDDQCPGTELAKNVDSTGCPVPEE